MFTFLKRFLGSKPVAPTAPTPYKVEAPKVDGSKVAKKPVAKKTTTAKPRKPKAPKA